MITPELKQAALEKQLQKLVQQVNELNKRVQFLERENSRRKVEIASKKG
jgi:peptidoglycan hydrolase CwlO-like protein